VLKDYPVHVLDESITFMIDLYLNRPAVCSLHLRKNIRAVATLISDLDIFIRVSKIYVKSV